MNSCATSSGISIFSRRLFALLCLAPSLLFADGIEDHSDSDGFYSSSERDRERLFWHQHRNEINSITQLLLSNDPPFWGVEDLIMAIAGDQDGPADMRMDDLNRGLQGAAIDSQELRDWLVAQEVRAHRHFLYLVGEARRDWSLYREYLTRYEKLLAKIEGRQQRLEMVLRPMSERQADVIARSEALQRFGVHRLNEWVVEKWIERRRWNLEMQDHPSLERQPGEDYRLSELQAELFELTASFRRAYLKEYFELAPIAVVEDGPNRVVPQILSHPDSLNRIPDQMFFPLEKDNRGFRVGYLDNTKVWTDPERAAQRMIEERWNLGINSRLQDVGIVRMMMLENLDASMLRLRNMIERSTNLPALRRAYQKDRASFSPEEALVQKAAYHLPFRRWMRLITNGQVADRTQQLVSGNRVRWGDVIVSGFMEDPNFWGARDAIARENGRPHIFDSLQALDGLADSLRSHRFGSGGKRSAPERRMFRFSDASRMNASVPHLNTIFEIRSGQFDVKDLPVFFVIPSLEEMIGGRSSAWIPNAGPTPEFRLENKIEIEVEGEWVRIPIPMGWDLKNIQIYDWETAELLTRNEHYELKTDPATKMVFAHFNQDRRGIKSVKIQAAYSESQVRLGGTEAKDIQVSSERSAQVMNALERAGLPRPSFETGPTSLSTWVSWYRSLSVQISNSRVPGAELSGDVSDLQLFYNKDKGIFEMTVFEAGRMLAKLLDVLLQDQPDLRVRLGLTFIRPPAQLTIPVAAQAPYVEIYSGDTRLAFYAANPGKTHLTNSLFADRLPDFTAENLNLLRAEAQYFFDFMKARSDQLSLSDPSEPLTRQLRLARLIIRSENLDMNEIQAEASSIDRQLAAGLHHMSERFSEEAIARRWPHLADEALMERVLRFSRILHDMLGRFGCGAALKSLSLDSKQEM